MGEDVKEEQGYPQDALKKAQQLLGSQNKGSIITTPEGTAIDIHGVLEIIDQMPQISLLNAQKGDVVWWTTRSGSSGSMLVEKPYTQSEENHMDYGDGSILISRGPEHPLKEQHGKGKVRGAMIGNTLKFARIIKDQSIEFDLTESGKAPKVYTSSPVTDMGIIKAAALKQA